MGVRASTLAVPTSDARSGSVSSEEKKLGASELTRIPRRPDHCMARSRVIPFMPAFDEE